MSEVNSKILCKYEKYEMEFTLQSCKNEQRDRDTIANLNNILFKNKMLLNSLYWNTFILLSTVTIRGGIYVRI